VPVALLETLIVAVGKQMGDEARASCGSEELHKLRRKYKKVLPKRL